VGSHYDYQYLFHGAIDELCILDKALTPEQVLFLYENPDGCKCKEDNREFVQEDKAE
jgi:hypothetical protein